MALSIEQAVEHVTDFLVATDDARQLSEKCRDYYDHIQWTPEEIAKLRKRKQAPVVVNRIQSKVDGLVGLHEMRQSDPKAFPRTPQHEQAAPAITDALRYVDDNTEYDTTRLDVGEDFWIEGYGGVFIGVRRKASGEREIYIDRIPWDRIYFDPRARRRDFRDARYKGLIMWLDFEEAEEMFPGFNPHNAEQPFASDDWTFEDRPRWLDTKQKRVKVALEFYLKKGQWYMCAFSGSEWAIKPQLSPYLDEDDQPTCPIELVGSRVNRENQWYSETAAFLDRQDEINHRRSKYLHSLSSRQTWGRKGASTDVNQVKRALAAVDGHAEFDGNEFGKDFGILPTADMSKAQFDLYQDAKAELDAVSFNAQLAGERQQGDLSGVAIARLQRAGVLELGRQYKSLSNFDLRVYTQVWWRIRQYWSAEKWVRVTDDYEDLRWVGFNIPITYQQALEETINNTALDPITRRQAAQIYVPMLQAQDPRLQEMVETRNDVAKTVVDIIIEESDEVINAEQEAFETLAKFGTSEDLDIIDLLELSPLRNKDELIRKIERRRQQRMQATGNLAQMEAENKQADTALKYMTAAEREQNARQKKVETAFIIENPGRSRAVV